MTPSGCGATPRATPTATLWPRVDQVDQRRRPKIKKFCWDLYPELAPAYKKAIADAGLPESTLRKVSLREVLQKTQSNKGTKILFEQVKEAVAKATLF